MIPPPKYEEQEVDDEEEVEDIDPKLNSHSNSVLKQHKNEYSNAKKQNHKDAKDAKFEEDL